MFKKHYKKLVALTMSLLLLGNIYAFATSSTDSSTSASSSAIAEKVLAEVTALYRDFYTISDATAFVSDQGVNKDGVTYTINVSFKRTLLANDATEIPAIQGLIAAKAQLTDPEKILAADEYIAARVADLNDNYIGVAQDTTGVFKVTLPTKNRTMLAADDALNISSIVMEDALGDAVVPASSIAPKSDSEQMQAGEDLLMDVVSSEKNSFARDNLAFATTTRSTNIQLYDRVAARNYARNWSCTGAYLYDHASCHNPNYSFFNNVDCANFVSQCIHEGGLPTDGTWYKNSSPWTSCTSLRNYMTNNNLFFHSYNKGFAGSIINWIDANGNSTGHVGLVDQNDTIVATFCAHTKCRRSCPIGNERVDYYIPLWDSYAGTWTQR